MNSQMQQMVKTSPEPAFTPAQAGQLQRKKLGEHEPDENCPRCSKGLLNLQRKSANLTEPSYVPPIVHEVLNSPGQPLDNETRAFMEPRFGHDFSKVQIHTDDKAAESARGVNALAYTVGRDIVFGSGQYVPEGVDGKQLIAHELTHVMQQNRDMSSISHVDGEQEADQVSAALGRGAFIRVTGNSMPSLARQAASPAPAKGTAFAPTIFNPGEMHDHNPTGKWADVQADSAPTCLLKGVVSPILAASVECACAFGSPESVLKLARSIEMSGKPLAQRHLDHYLTGGGTDLPVDLEDVIRRDVGVRAVLASEMRRTNRGWVKIEQSNYDVEDFQYAFGAIDRLDFEVDPATGNAHVWFKDRYEFHPVGFGYSSLPGDVIRPTNCVHAAAVELKASGAADYWMVGDALVPVSLFGGPFALSWGKSERQEGEIL